MPVSQAGTTPTVAVSVPIPVPVQQKPKPKSKPTAAPQTQPQVAPAPVVPTGPSPVGFGGTMPHQHPKNLSAVVLPWSPMPAQKMSRLPGKRMKVVRYSASQNDLAALLRNARQQPYEHSTHGLIADALDELHPGNVLSDLIRRQYGLGNYAEQGPLDNLWHDPFYNSYDGTHPYAAHLGTHGPFDLYLLHEGTPEAQGDNQRWVLRAVSRMKGSRDSGYNFEFPHEQAHEIPRMFPTAENHIVTQNVIPYSSRFRNREAVQFDDRMDEQERNR